MFFMSFYKFWTDDGKQVSRWNVETTTKSKAPVSRSFSLMILPLFFFSNKFHHVFTWDCSAPLAVPHILKERTEHIYEVQQPLCKTHSVQGIANMVCVCVYVMTDLWPWHWACKCLFPMHLCFAHRQFVDGLLRPNLFCTGLKISIAQAWTHHNSLGSSPGSIR